MYDATLMLYTALELTVDYTNVLTDNFLNEAKQNNLYFIPHFVFPAILTQDNKVRKTSNYIAPVHE